MLAIWLKCHILYFDPHECEFSNESSYVPSQKFNSLVYLVASLILLDDIPVWCYILNIYHMSASSWLLRLEFTCLVWFNRLLLLFSSNIFWFVVLHFAMSLWICFFPYISSWSFYFTSPLCSFPFFFFLSLLVLGLKLMLKSWFHLIWWWSSCVNHFILPVILDAVWVYLEFLPRQCSVLMTKEGTVCRQFYSWCRSAYIL